MSLSSEMTVTFTTFCWPKTKFKEVQIQVVGYILHPLMGGASKIIIMVISTFQSYYEIRYLIKKYLANALNIYIYPIHAKLHAHFVF